MGLNVILSVQTHARRTTVRSLTTRAV